MKKVLASALGVLVAGLVIATNTRAEELPQITLEAAEPTVIQYGEESPYYALIQECAREGLETRNWITNFQAEDSPVGKGYYVAYEIVNEDGTTTPRRIEYVVVENQDGD